MTSNSTSREISEKVKSLGSDTRTRYSLLPKGGDTLNVYRWTDG